MNSNDERGHSRRDLLYELFRLCDDNARASERICNCLHGGKWV
jgi:hypothetical protein